MAKLKLENLNKIYPNGFHAVIDFNLDIEDEEFVVFVGPSGCGKSTTLRMIAGLEEITKGNLYIDDLILNDAAPKDRNIAMVFQSYALYPHLTVYDNIAFGLKLRKETDDVIHQRVHETSDILGLTPYLDRKPKQLSGGQRQRVALGRAIVRKPKVFLMDEPLSNLDAKLRIQMRGELIKLHKKLKTTTVYVTHDQTEAMTMASKIVVMKDGYIMQIGTPKYVYDNPNNMFVGGFLGTPAMNFMSGIIDDLGTFTFRSGQILNLPKSQMKILEKNNFLNKEIYIGLRPKDIYYDPNQEFEKGTRLNVVVDISEMLGNETYVHTTISRFNIVASIKTDEILKPGQIITLGFDLENALLFDPKTEIRIVDKDTEEIKYLKELAISMNEKRKVDNYSKDDYKNIINNLNLEIKNNKNRYQEQLTKLKVQFKKDQIDNEENAKLIFIEERSTILNSYNKNKIELKKKRKELKRDLKKL